VKLLNTAKRPLFLFGGGVNIARANDLCTEVVRKTGVPVITSVMGRGSIPTDDSLFVGNLGMHGAYAANKAVGECDLLFSIGTRFNDRITGKLDQFAPKAKIVHIDADTSSISRNINVDIPVVADAKEALLKLNELVEPRKVKAWVNQINEWQKECPMDMRKHRTMGPKDIIDVLNKTFDQVILTADVGQHQMYVAQYAELNAKKRLIMSGGLGTMGYGFPAAIGAKIGNPGVPTVAICGDGGFQMNIQEFATAVLEELPVIICVFNNMNLGMVRQWQKLFYGKRYSMTNLRSGVLSRESGGEQVPEYTPDFVKVAESYGALGIRVEHRDEIKTAFHKAKENKKGPTLIEFVIDPEEMVYPMVKPGGALEDMIVG